MSQVKEVEKSEDVGVAEFRFRRKFMGMDHNYLCAVCRENLATIEIWQGVLQPCRRCQEEGYKLIKLQWFDRLLGRADFMGSDC